MVIDRALLSSHLHAGHVLSGWFWLSGRLNPGTTPKANAGWLRRMF